MKNPIPYFRCVVCRGDPEPGTGRYGRYGNRSMVCKYCKKKTRHAIENDIPLEVKFPQLARKAPGEPSVKPFVLFKCRGHGCGVHVIASRNVKTRKCPGCGHVNPMAKIKRNLIIKQFDTWEEASDGLRLLKLPGHLREDPANYQSTIWRDP